jgi:hypothetical protein
MANVLGVSSNTAVAAVEQLEREGFLKPQGHGRRSQITLPEDFSRPAYRVTLLLYDHEDLQTSQVAEIHQCLKEAGYVVNPLMNWRPTESKPGVTTYRTGSRLRKGSVDALIPFCIESAVRPGPGSGL